MIDVGLLVEETWSNGIRPRSVFLLSSRHESKWEDRSTVIRWITKRHNLHLPVERWRLQYTITTTNQLSQLTLHNPWLTRQQSKHQSGHKSRQQSRHQSRHQSRQQSRLPPSGRPWTRKKRYFHCFFLWWQQPSYRPTLSVIWVYVQFIQWAYF